MPWWCVACSPLLLAWLLVGAQELIGRMNRGSFDREVSAPTGLRPRNDTQTSEVQL